MFKSTLRLSSTNEVLMTSVEVVSFSFSLSLSLSTRPLLGTSNSRLSLASLNYVPNSLISVELS